MKGRRRRRLTATPLTGEQRALVERNVPYVARLCEADRQELAGRIQVFLAEKNFEACGGLQMTDEIRLTIAAQACVLLLHRDDDDVYPKLSSILVYPHAYVAHVDRPGPGGTILGADEARLGESWTHGSVVLSWDDVLGGAADVHDGHNVVFHEFAHQLDAESGSVEGAPLLPQRSMYLAWARVLSREYTELVDRVDHHRPTLLDPYGATSPAEFFAVATECFFEKGKRLAERHPELYEQLRLFYRQDPAARTARSTA